MSRQIQLSIPTMKCSHCAATIKTALDDAEHINSVSIDLESKTALINTHTDTTYIVAIIHSVGHDAEITE